MNISIDITQIIYQNTGVARYTENLVLNLLKKDQKNKYILFAFSTKGKEILQNFKRNLTSINQKFKLIVFPIPEKVVNYMGNNVHLFPLDMLIPGIDVYHSSDWIQFPTKAKKVTTVHDLVVYKFPQTSDEYIIKTHKKRLSWVKKECDMVISDSDATKKDLISVLKISPNKIKTVYPGINKNFIPKSDKEITKIKNKYHLNKKYILTLGKIEPRKNFPALIKAFDKLLSKYTSNMQDFELIIIGNQGWQDKLNSAKNKRILSYIDDIDLPSIYSGAELFVYPSLYEGFGFPVIEAMACGCPVAASDRGSLKEIVNDHGVFFDPTNEKDMAEKIFSIINNSKLKQSLKENGLEYAKSFSWEKTADEVINIYQNLNKYADRY